MVSEKVTVITCDKCGFEDTDPSKFFHVLVTAVVLVGKHKTFSERDLCESCVGLPGVNRDA